MTKLRKHLFTKANKVRRKYLHKKTMSFIDYTDFRCNLTNKNNFISP